MKPKFDIKNYPGKYVMAIGSEENAKTFCGYMLENGKWPDCDTRYYIYGDQTAYNFNSRSFSPVSWYVNHEYTILYFDDYDWSDFTMKKFTKKDLKNGDVILHRNGTVGIVIPETDSILYSESYERLGRYDNNLLCSLNDRYDIMEVRRPNVFHECFFNAFTRECGALVYKREEVEEMTLEEVCKALGKEIKIVKSK